MHSSSILAALLSAVALALPSLPRRARHGSPQLSLPPSALPPAAGVLKYVGLGIGTQNYTCSTPYSSAVVPSAVGALAQLSDARAFLQQNQETIKSLPVLALSLHAWTNVNIGSILALPALGVHFFNSAGSPTFDLSAVDARLVAKKAASTPAPANAFPGVTDEGAVPWLYLTDAGVGTTYGGVAGVYRVETAGGNPPATCEHSPAAFEVDYAAEYWFYGPP